MEVVEVYSDADRKFRDVQDSLRIGFGYADNSAVDLMIDERMSLLDEILESLAELRLVVSGGGVMSGDSILASPPPPLPTPSTAKKSRGGDGGFETNSNISLKQIKEYDLTPPSSPPKIDIKEIPLDTTGDGIVDMIGYDVNNNGRPDYVGLVGDGDEVTKLVPLKDLDSTTVEMINLALANENVAESPVKMDGIEASLLSTSSKMSASSSDNVSPVANEFF